MEECALNSIPRLIIAGTGGDSGKTLVSLCLAAFWKSQGHAVAAFKKGPDFIDSSWLRWASGNPARNLDSYMLGREKVHELFFDNIDGFDIALIEGNRGLHDGFDSDGTHSTAELAKIIDAPVILVVSGRKVTRTAAAIVLGCMNVDPDVKIAGVIFNQVSGERHKKILQQSVESICNIPVLGFIPPLGDKLDLPSRHLGLVTPEEHPKIDLLRNVLIRIAGEHLEVERILKIADRFDHYSDLAKPQPTARKIEQSAKICYFRDSAFTFYYPDNIEALESAGAKMIPVSSLHDESLPECHGLFIGGGFPETHLRQLTFNLRLSHSVKKAADRGMPIYAECGGLIYLCETLRWGEDEFRLSGVLPLTLQMERKPQGHGYCEVEVDGDNPFFSPGNILKGHEFHYTRVVSGEDKVDTVYSVKRGTGCFDKRDGIIYKNVLAAYLHIHAAGCPQWAENFVQAAVNWKKSGG